PRNRWLLADGGRRGYGKGGLGAHGQTTPRAHEAKAMPLPGTSAPTRAGGPARQSAVLILRERPGGLLLLPAAHRHGGVGGSTGGSTPGRRPEQRDRRPQRPV